MAYVVTGTLRGETVTHSRTREASAAVLAIKLLEKGYTDVAIVDQDGVRWSLAGFRRKFFPKLFSILREPK